MIVMTTVYSTYRPGTDRQAKGPIRHEALCRTQIRRYPTLPFLGIVEHRRSSTVLQQQKTIYIKNKPHLPSGLLCLIQIMAIMASNVT